MNATDEQDKWGTKCKLPAMGKIPCYWFLVQIAFSQQHIRLMTLQPIVRAVLTRDYLPPVKNVRNWMPALGGWKGPV
jgi:hypothetical protein